MDSDIKISYNKVLTKMELDVKIMYLTEENQVSTVNSKIPVVGFIDILNISENNICDVDYEIKNMIIKPNNIEDHSIYLEAEVGMSCIAFEEKEIKLIQDLYSTNSDILFSKRQIQTISNKELRNETCKIKEIINLPEAEEGSLIDVEAKATINKENIFNSKIMYEGEIEYKFIFSDKNYRNINNKSVVVPFEFTIDDIQSGENLDVNTILEIKNTDFIVQSSGNINCSTDIIFHVNMYKNISLDIIDEINIDESNQLNDYSLIIYIVKQEDTLWKIAKKFKSTIDEIVIANKIENPEKISVGQKLYIPKKILKTAIGQNVKYV